MSCDKQGDDASVEQDEFSKEGGGRGWGWLFAAAEKQDKPQEVASCFTCPLTMEVFRDPGHHKQRTDLRKVCPA